MHKLRLNAAKCSFEVSSRKFLGHLVTRQGIEANPEQITAINNLVSPRIAKEVQKLTGIATALNRFINKSSDMLAQKVTQEGGELGFSNLIVNEIN